VGKHFTSGIEGNNGNVRHNLGRFTRRTKVVSKSEEMVNASLKLQWWLQNPNNFIDIRDKFLSYLSFK
jgi:insertion element IS1 protein InsB